MSLFTFKWSSTIILVLSKIQRHHLEGELSGDHSDKTKKPTSERLQWSQAYLHPDQTTCKGAVVYSSRAMLPCRLKAPDRGETTERVHEWKRRNIVHISSLNVCKGKWTEPRTVGENISFSFFFFFSFLEVLQDNMITAQGLKEKKHGGIGTKWNPTDAIVLLLNQGSLQKAVLSSLLCSPFLRLFLSVCHFLFSSPPFPVVSMLSIPTYLTWLSLHFAARFSLLL